ncbi:MAG TPA: DUF2269 family protein [Gaiellaceae bacterium]|nr:DUF2269 family protein [Gaiellaceae bacterium]
MSWFELLLFFHVAMAVIWIGGGLMMQLFGIRASMSGDPARLAALGQDIEWIANRTFIPASLLAFVSGILLVVESDFYGFGDDWIVIALVLYATTFLAGILFLGPESGRVGRMTAEGSPEAGPRMLRLIFLSRLDLVLLWLIVYAMTVKPDVGDAGSLLWGIAGALVAAGLLYWRYRVALAQPAPAPSEAA